MTTDEEAFKVVPDAATPQPIDHDLLAKKLAEVAEHIAALQGMLSSHQAFIAGVAQSSPTTVRRR